MNQRFEQQPDHSGDLALAGAVLGVVALAVVLWAGLQLAALLAGHLYVGLHPATLAQALLRWPTHAGDPRLAFPAGVRADLPGGPVLYLALSITLAVVGTVAALGWRLAGGGRQDRRAREVEVEVARRGQASRRELRQAYRPSRHSLVVGRAKGRTLSLSSETSFGVVMGSRMGKTSAAVGWVLDHQGPVLATSTKTDLLYLTAGRREHRTDQPVWVLDPEGLAGWPDQVRWSPVRGCEVPVVAQERATALIAGVHADGVTNGAFFRGKAAGLLRLTLHAAALEGAGVDQLRRWTGAPGASSPAIRRILNGQEAADPWGEEWDGLVSGDKETLANIAATASLALDCLAVPEVAKLCSPGEGEAFDPVEWLRSGGTLHLVASGTAAASAAPLAAALVDAVMRAVRQVAPGGGDGRLDPPLRCVLDELPSVAPLPGLPGYLADGGGQGVQLVCMAQAMSQYAIPYGRDGRRAIEAAFGALLVGGGIKDPDELRRYGELAGEVDVRGYADRRERRRVMDAAELGRLGRHQGLLLSHATKPAVVSLLPWWKRPDHRAISRARGEARKRAGKA